MLVVTLTKIYLFFFAVFFYRFRFFGKGNKVFVPLMITVVPESGDLVMIKLCLSISSSVPSGVNRIFTLMGSSLPPQLIRKGRSSTKRKTLKKDMTKAILLFNDISGVIR